MVLCVGTRLIDFATGSRSLFQDPDVRFVGAQRLRADAHKLGALPLVADAARARGAARRSPRRLARARAGRERELRRARALGARAGRRPPAARRRADDPGPGAAGAQRGGGPGDWLVVAAGRPHVDLLKLWDARRGGRCLMEFGSRAWATRCRPRSGSGWREPDAGEIYVVIGDGTYLMGGRPSWSRPARRG